MSYSYEKIENHNSDYLDKLDRIESMRMQKMSDSVLSSIMKNDIYESTKIEGNGLSRYDVTNFLDDHVTIRGKGFRDYAQIHNYQFVLDSIKELVKSDSLELTEDLICMIHKMVTNNELSTDESGVYRNDVVHIRTTDYVPPLDTEVPMFMKELIDEFNKPLEVGETTFERICEFKRNFERIHPFFDGNGRTGRAIMNVLFLSNGYGYVSIPADERDLYFDSLENNTFSDFAADKMLESMEILKDKLEMEMIL